MNRRYIQKLGTIFKSIWEKFIQNRPVYKKLHAKHERTTADLDKARHNLNALSGKHDALSHKYELTEANLDETHRNFNALSLEHRRAKAELDKAQHDLKNLHAEHKHTKANLIEAHREYNVLQEKHGRTTTALAEARRNLKNLREEHNQTKVALAEAHAEHDKLCEKHVDLDQKYTLVSNLLTAKSSENKVFEEFKKLFEGEFMDFANKESSLAEEASVVQKLQRVEKRLEEIVAFPHTFMKKSIAIGGGIQQWQV